MRKTFYHIWMIPATLCLALLGACSREPLPEQRNDAKALIISPALLDIQENAPVTRADEPQNDAQFNENRVARLDVFIFQGTTLKKDYHITTEGGIVSYGGKSGYLLSHDWLQDGLAKDVAYKVYVIANSTNASVTTAGAITAENDLKALSTEDEDIYKRYNADAPATDNTYSPSKTFLMNAKVDSWTITDMNTQLISDNTVQLERAAVKFVVDIQLTDEFRQRLADKEMQYGRPSWKYANFNSVTPEIKLAADDEAYPEEKLVIGGSGKYLTVVPETNGHYSIVTYAYPQQFTALDKCPGLFLSFPATPVGSDENATPSFHYYYIPLVAKGTTATLRNNVYQVNARISSFGSTEAVANDEVLLTYDVLPWGTSSASVDAQPIDYLLATPTRYSFKGGNEGEWLSTDIRYYASGNVTVEGVRGFYKDRTGAEVVVTNGFQVGTPSNGKITIRSQVPTNGTLREVEFTVRCGNKTETVKFRHYPLDFVTGIASHWCSYDDDTFAQWGQTGKTYMASGEKNGHIYYIESLEPKGFFAELIQWILNLIFDGNLDDAFSSRVWQSGKIYNLTLNGGQGSLVENSGDNINNQMYMLQITSSNDNYTLGRPTLTSGTSRIHTYKGGGITGLRPIDTELHDVTYYTSQDDVISPAFMLASQITTLLNQFSTAETAAAHCALYKEVGQDGYVYTGWRLPTKQEIQFMIENQVNKSDAMIQVLTGSHYWALDGSKVRNTNQTGGNGNFVRCVRDVKPEELARINQF